MNKQNSTEWKIIQKSRYYIPSIHYSGKEWKTIQNNTNKSKSLTTSTSHEWNIIMESNYSCKNNNMDNYPDILTF